MNIRHALSSILYQENNFGSNNSIIDVSIMFQILYQCFFDNSSASDVCSMVYNMNVVGCSNARGNVIDTFNECKEYVTFETNCYVVAMALKHFNMKFSSSEEDVIPPTIRASDRNKRQKWLHHQVTEMLKEHIMKIHAETIEEVVHSFAAIHNFKCYVICPYLQKGAFSWE